MESVNGYGDSLDSNQSLKEKINNGVYKISTKRKARSEVWDIFGEIIKPNGSFVAGVVFCRGCHAILKFNGKQTSNLNRHKCFILKKKSLPLKPTMKRENDRGNEDDGESRDVGTETEIEANHHQLAAAEMLKAIKMPEEDSNIGFRPKGNQQSDRNAASSYTPQMQSIQPTQPVASYDNKSLIKLDDPRVNAAYDILKATVAKNDECAIYGEHVASKMRQYSSRTRSIVQHHINNVLFEADIGKYNIQHDPLTCVDSGDEADTSSYSTYVNRNKKRIKK